MPSPKSGKSGTAKPPLDPLKAGESGNAKRGDVSQARSKVAQKKANKHGLVKVNPIEKSGSNGTINSPPVTPITVKRKGVCTDVGLFMDGEGRNCSSSRVLEIVPPMLSANDTIIFARTSACSCPGPLYQLDGSKGVPLKQPASISAVEELKNGDNLTDLSWWFHVAPRKTIITFVCGNDLSNIESGELRIFPNNKQTIKWDITKLLEKHPDVAALVNEILSVISKITGKEITAKEDVIIPGNLIYVIIKRPEFTFSFEGKWEEYSKNHQKHWEAYYGFKVSIEGTIFSIKFKVDLLNAITYLPQLAPFKVMVFDPIWPKIRDALTDGESPPFYIGLSGDLKGAVSLERNPDWRPSGGITMTGLLSIGMFLKCRILEGEFEANTGLTADLSIKGEGDVANLDYNALKFDGVKGKVSITLDSGWVGKWGYEREVEILKAAEHGLIHGTKRLIG